MTSPQTPRDDARDASIILRQMAADRATIARLRSQEAILSQSLLQFGENRKAGTIIRIAHRLDAGLRLLQRATLRVALILRWAATGALLSHYRFWQANRATRSMRSRESASEAARRSSTALATLANDRPAALILDYQVPRPDRDAGSIYLINMIERLLRRGFDVHLSVVERMENDEAYCEQLRCMGVSVTYQEHVDDLSDPLRALPDRLELCFVTRVYGGGRYIERVIECCPHSRIVFNTIDLHFVRVERQNAISPTKQTEMIAQETRRRECRVAELSDATIVVSTAEKAILEDILPGTHVYVVPLAAETLGGRAVPSFADRSNLGFVGGFLHQPNVDAVRYFLDDIWPLVRERLPNVEFEIVGSDLPADLEARTGRDGIRYLGHVPDLQSWLGGLRMTVAPLRFGAGAKGKVLSSLAAGVPCVLTSIAAEGMGLGCTEVCVADTERDFAERILALYEDESVWAPFSQAGLANAAGTAGRADEAFDELLLGLGLLKIDLDSPNA